MNELYRTLGVSPSVSEAELKAAYRKLAKQFHPDLHPGDQQAEAKFKELNEAWETLGDPEKRKKYDQAQGSAHKRVKRPAGTTRRPTAGAPDFAQMQNGFAQFFGFDPKTGEITNESKLSGREKNPLDVSHIFEKFMGFK